MITLGINAAVHDSSAVLVVDGEVVAAAEEERFTRVRHEKRSQRPATLELPWHAIDYCLGHRDARLVDVHHVSYSFDPRDLPAVRHAPHELASGAPHHLRPRFDGARHDGPYRFHFVAHHLAHQASAFLASPFDRCAVMTLDGGGEHAVTAYGAWRDGVYEAIGESRPPHALGLLVEQAAAHLGFQPASDEHKVMALAALGTPRFHDALQAHVHLDAHGVLRIDTIDWQALAGRARPWGAELEPVHLDLAASLQAVLEDTVALLASWLRKATGERCLAMAGSVALNCVMNSALRDARIFQDLWIQPAAGDAGTALGAALWTDARERAGQADDDAQRRERIWSLAPRRWRMRSAYLGPPCGDDETGALLERAGLPCERVDDPAAVAAELLAQGKVIGWVQGRMEFGPHALGARSILASPLDAAMQVRINELNDREDFGSVAPAVPREKLSEWFCPASANRGDAPFMAFVYDVLPRQAARIPAACQGGGSARVQTVSRLDHALFHRLLTLFGERTGVPVLINAAFKVRGGPLVCTASDAVEAFYVMPLDALVIGSYVLRKPQRAHAGAAATQADAAERPSARAAMSLAVHEA
jgi:carbamoyltransferase